MGWQAGGRLFRLLAGGLWLLEVALVPSASRLFSRRSCFMLLGALVSAVSVLVCLRATPLQGEQLWEPD